MHPKIAARKKTAPGRICTYLSTYSYAPHRRRCQPHTGHGLLLEIDFDWELGVEDEGGVVPTEGVSLPILLPVTIAFELVGS